MLGILAAPLHFRLVVRIREWFFLACQLRTRAIASKVELRSFSVVYELPALVWKFSYYLWAIMRSLKHDGAVPELLD